MPTKAEMYAQMADKVAIRLTGSWKEWTAFLTTAARLYKYPYHEQLMIYAQRPDATACAEYELWNARMGRYIRRGSTGIALLDDSGDRLRLRYVFDVSDTGERENSHRLYLWKMEDEHYIPVTTMLERNYGVDGDSLPQQLTDVAGKLTDEYWMNHQQELLSIVDDSFLAGYDDLNVGLQFKSAVTVSTAYALMSRCGLDPETYFDHEDFMAIFDFNTPAAVAAIGTAVSQLNQQVLRQIGITIQNADREKQEQLHRADTAQPERRTHHEERIDLHEERGLSDSEPDHRRTAPESVGQVRQDAESLSEGTPSNSVQPDAADRETVSSSAGDRGNREQSPGADDAKTDAGVGRDRTAESTGSDEMGRLDEQLQSPGRGNDSGGTYQQLTLNLFLSEQEQIQNIEEGSSVLTPGSFSLNQETVDIILRSGGNQENTRLRIVAEYQKNKTPEEIGPFLQKECSGGKGFHTESGNVAVWFDRDGIRMVKGNAARYDRSAQLLSWTDAAKRIGELLEDGSFATNVELAEASGYERIQLAQSIWYLCQDFSDKVREDGMFPSLSEFKHSSFPKETEELAVQLENPVFLEKLTEECQQFIVAYQADRGMLRFHFHRPVELLQRLKELALPRREYESNLTEQPLEQSFITEDEINAVISSGSNMVGGKDREYTFFTENHTSKEQIDFLKKEHGIGSHVPALSGASRSSEDHDSKGITLKKGLSHPVKLSWGQVAKRITTLIRQDRYYTAEENARYKQHLREQKQEAQAAESTAEIIVDRDINEHEPQFYDQIRSEVLDETDHHLREKLRPITQDDIDDALCRWNGNPESKRNVVYYMEDHARDRETAEWLSHEYGGTVTKALLVTRAGEDESEQLPWTKVQRRVAQLIQEDRFLTNEEKSNEAAQVEQAERRYQVVVYHHFENGFDARLEYRTLQEAEMAAQSYVAGTLETDGFSYDGAAVYDLKEQKFLSIFGDYPDENARAQVGLEKHNTGIRRNTQNFHITDDLLGTGGVKSKFRANINAIKLLKNLEGEGLQALPDQQEVLSHYVGWGGLSDAFESSKENWRKEYTELKELLTPAEYEAARASTLNAHYTSPVIIRSIYEALDRMGFRTGNILEPSCGVGNFLGMLPEKMSGSRLYGVELDSLSGRIAGMLYPQANITVAGFETTDRKDFFDVAIGNVPFGQYVINDQAYNKLGFSIHNYFFAKTLDQVRPGGVIAFVTSRYTMDAKDSSARSYIAQRADLLGAFRLPNNAFLANAGTDVVSDILFLQKRDRPITTEPDWVHLGQNDDGFSINSYFIEHPEMILGRQTSENTKYGRQDFTVEPIDGLTLSDQLHDAVKYIRGSYQEATLPELGEGGVIDTSLPADPDVKNYSYTVVDGQVYFRENSRMVRPELNATAEARVKALVELRDCVHQLIDLQMDNYTSDHEIQGKQAELNLLYNSFSAKYGLINDRANRLAFAEDSSYYLLCSLEVLNEEGKLERKADMFTKRTIRQHSAVSNVDTAAEALAVSIAEKARVDMEYMSELTGKGTEEITAELTGVIFKDPAYGSELLSGWKTADEYLSGNVRIKLRAAQRAAEHDPTYAVNVEALKTAQPKDLDASEIGVRLGATWIDPEYIRQFMYETLNTPRYLRSTIDVKYAAYTAEWQITGKTQVRSNDIAACTTYGTDRANAYRILEDSLNLRDIRIYDMVEDVDGRERRVLNGKETTLAAQKQQVIREAFKEWIWKDPERRQVLVHQYNEEMNSTRPREYDGSHIVFSGMNPEIQLREHQKNAIAHVLYGGNTLLAHEVGAGKTFEMVAAAMESKRLGLCTKSMFVVPNHLTEQWASEFLRLYPSANILVTTKKDFETHRRKKFCSRIATGDYDAVIIGHSQFERIPISRERQEQLLREQIDEITEGVFEVEASGGERFTVRQLERTRRVLEARLEKLQADGRKDDVVTFEQLGVDRLFVDESHNYKNLFLYTKMRNVAGLATTDAQKSSDMFAKCRYMDEQTDGRGVVFATGTPVSNSMTELYTVQRYLQYDRLKELNMTHFDCWASRFGETVTALELAPEGTGYRARTRFSKFFNLPELMNLFKEIADIKTADQLHLPTPEVEYHNIVAQPTEHQQNMVKALSERAAEVHNGNVEPSVDNMLKITSDGRKLGLDQRIINSVLPDEDGTKVNQCVNNVLQIWQDGQDEKLTQLVFCDISTPKAAPTMRAAKAISGNLDNPELHGQETAIDLPEPESPFTVYEDIRQKLIERGIPAEQIAFIHEANTEVRKKELFAKVRTGQVRVLLGSTSKMGAGTNVQDRLVALHDLDCPWRPGDLAQRKGRIERQGNGNERVHVFRYVTEGTFDAYLWQTVENKQKFISQIMTSKSPVRSCDDVDEAALSYAEIKALCAGDPRIKERMDLDVEVSRLKLMKADHQSKQYRLEDNLLKHFPEQIETNKGFIKGLQADMATLAAHPHPGDGFAGMEVRGDKLTDKENAGAALLDACKEVTGSEPVVIGNYRGFTMSVSFSAFEKEYELALRGEMTHGVELGTDPKGNLIRIDNALAQMPQRLESINAQLENLFQQQAAAKAEVGKPFLQEAELREKSARLVELDMLLNMDGKGGSRDTMIAKSARPSVLDGLKRSASPRTAESKTKKHEEVR